MADEATALVPVNMQDKSQVMALLAGLQEMEVTDPTEITRAQLQRILFAETEEEAFAELPTWNAEEAEGVPLLIDDVILLPSKYNNGKGAFASASATNTETGEVGILNTSAARVAGRLAWLRMHGKLPRTVIVTTITEATAAGRKVYGLDLVG